MESEGDLTKKENIEERLSAKEYEKASEELIKQFPLEWQEDMHDDLVEIDEDDEEGLKDFYLALKERFEKRDDAIKQKFSAYGKEEKYFKDYLPPGLTKELLERNSKEYQELIKDIASDEYKKAGEGLSAIVKIKEAGEKQEGLVSRVCFKNIVRYENYKNDNSIKQELKLQNECLKIKIPGNRCRVPKPYYYYMDKYTHFCAMEYIDGGTVQEILDEEKPLPEGFETDKFFNDVLEYLEEMHKRKIYHRDLHKGNIMLEFKGSDPVIIDFGKSIDANVGYTEDPYKEGGSYLNDIESLKGIRTEMISFINKKKGG